MKVLLTIDTPPLLSGYTIFSPFIGHNFSLDYLDDGEAEEIICDKVLNYIPIEHLTNFLKLLSGKLTHGGKLIVIATDSVAVAREYFFERIDTMTYNNLIYGTKKNAWDFKQSIVSLDEITDISKDMGLKIISRKLHNLQFSITIERI